MLLITVLGNTRKVDPSLRKIYLQTIFHWIYHIRALVAYVEIMSSSQMFLWLVIQNKCGTSDRLVQKGIPHPE